MPSSPVYLDLTIVEKSFLKMLIGRNISGTVSQVGGDETVPSFLSKKERKQIDDLLKLYRNPQNQTRITTATVNSLGAILSKIIGPYNKPGDFSSLLLRVKPDCLQLISNIPWELAAIRSIDTAVSPDFSMLLADRPFARTIEGYQSLIPELSDEKLRVHYCISDPSGNLNAADFKNDLDTALKERSAYVNVKLTEGPDVFNPSFDQLLIDIDQCRPDIFIIACHGKSSSGKPEVLFADGWKPVKSLAAAIQNTRNNSLVILIACDLTYANESLPSHSGAVTFIEKGIPSVIAMQSSIMVKCGRILLDSVINYLFSLIRLGEEEGTLLRAMSHARRQIFESLHGSNFTNLDWSFPALFVSSGNEDGLGKMRYWQLGYVSALRILRVKNFNLQLEYFPRPVLEQQLIQLYQSNGFGVCSIGGPPSSGKTRLLNYTGDRYYEFFINGSQNNFRQLLYIDFDQEARTLNKTIELFNVINCKIEAISPSSMGVRLIQKLKLSDKSRPGLNDDNQFIQEMDQKKAIYILDNLDEQQYKNLRPILDLASRDFRDSLIIVPGHTNDFQSLIQINHLTEEETRAYIDPKREGIDGNTVFQQTGGNFALKILTRCSKELQSLAKIA
jgi:hypothetical protein